jgi:hypothetical protein
MAEAISLARELGNPIALAWATLSGGILARLQNNPSEAEYLASDLIELSIRRNLAMWLPLGNIHLGWARAVSGDVPGGLAESAAYDTPNSVEKEAPNSLEIYRG